VGVVVEHGGEWDLAVVAVGGKGALHGRGVQAAGGELENLGRRGPDAGLGADGAGDRGEVVAGGEGDELHDAVYGGSDGDGWREVEADDGVAGVGRRGEREDAVDWAHAACGDDVEAFACGRQCCGAGV
jgi:hypothetical protein